VRETVTPRLATQSRRSETFSRQILWYLHKWSDLRLSVFFKVRNVELQIVNFKTFTGTIFMFVEIQTVDLKKFP
jgi:hypothetical protein